MHFEDTSHADWPDAPLTATLLLEGCQEGKRAFLLQILLKKQCFPLRLQCDKTTIRVIRNQVFPDKFLPVFHSAYISFQSARTRPVQIYIHSSSRWPILIQLLRSQELYKYVLSCDASAPWHAPQALFPFERNIACLSWPWICKKKELKKAHGKYPI